MLLVWNVCWTVLEQKSSQTGWKTITYNQLYKPKKKLLSTGFVRKIIFFRWSFAQGTNFILVETVVQCFESSESAVWQWSIQPVVGVVVAEVLVQETTSSVKIQSLSLTTCTSWRSGTGRLICCQLRQMFHQISDEVSSKCNKLTSGPKRCENMLCFVWIFAMLKAKTPEFNTILGFRQCDWASCTNFHQIKSCRGRERGRMHAPAASLAHVIREQTCGDRDESLV